jgi:hypothetical protein
MTCDVIASLRQSVEGAVVHQTEESTMRSDTTKSQGLLRFALIADGAVCVAMAVALVGWAGAMAAPLGLPEMILRVIGLVLLPWGGWLVTLGVAAVPARRAVRWVIILNLIFVADSVLLVLLAPWLGLAPTGLGVGAILAQAAAGAGAAALQWIGLRQGGVQLAAA